MNIGEVISSLMKLSWKLFWSTIKEIQAKEIVVFENKTFSHQNKKPRSSSRRQDEKKKLSTWLSTRKISIGLDRSVSLRNTQVEKYISEFYLLLNRISHALRDTSKDIRFSHFIDDTSLRSYIILSLICSQIIQKKQLRH